MSAVDTSTSAPGKPFGDPIDRVDGRLKVTGAARYAAEFPLAKLAHGFVVQSTIAAGQIAQIDTTAAERSPGVVFVLTHRNAPRLKQQSPQANQASGGGGASSAGSKSGGGDQQKSSGGGQQKESSSGSSGGGSGGSNAGSGGQGGGGGGQQGAQAQSSEGRADPFAKPYVLQDDQVRNFGQLVAVVVAESFEQARDAARLVRITYRSSDAVLDFERNKRRAIVPEKLLNPEVKPETKRGDFDHGWREGEVQVDATYQTPNLHNNPIEPHATIAYWEGGHVTLYDATQNVNGTQRNIASLFGIDTKQVRVVAQFIGGGFGCKGPTWEHTIATVMAAQKIQRPVKVVLERDQMFELIGYRPHTEQRIRLASTRDGKLTAIGQEILTPTNIRKEYIEPSGASTPMFYQSANLAVTHRTVPLHWPRGTIMRAPGECSGVNPFECAMDELALALKMDPIELRRINEPAQDPQKKLPWSSRSLLACFDQGAQRFGWSQRVSTPGTRREGRELVGVGVASATYPAGWRPTSAKVILQPDGRVRVQLAATDLGTGTYTVVTQVAAETLGVTTDRVRVEIGDTDFPQAPGSGGSRGASSFCNGVREACMNVRSKLAELIREDEASPLRGLNEGDLIFQDGRLVTKADPSRGESFETIVRRRAPQGVTASADAKPGDETKKYSMHAFGAHFAEVRVNQDTGEARVTRFLGAFACGRILNSKTATSQFRGAIVMGIGMALMEESIMDVRNGHFVTSNLAEYHVPVNRDIPEIDILMVEEHDPFVNPLGTKGLGEIGIVGSAAAVANAIYNATGKRIREFPITPDKLL